MKLKRCSALALLVTCVIVAGCGSDDGTATSSTVAGARSAASASSGATLVPTTVPDESSSTGCSAAGIALHMSDTSGLPAPVAAVRSEIVTAAANCDYDALQKVIDRHPDQFQFQVGAGATSPSATGYWMSIDAKEHVMLRLTQLLAMKGAVLTEGAVETHVWPAVHAGRRTDADWQELIESGAYTEQEVAAFRKNDLYFGYRVGILPDGTWTYFVAGD